MDSSKGTIFGVAAVAIAIVALIFSFQSSPTPVANDRNVAGERAGSQNFSDGATLGQATERWYAQELPVGSEEVLLFRNTFGKDVYADYGEVSVITGETASSSFLAYIIATSSSSIGASADFSTLNAQNTALLNGTFIATSSTATTTNSVYAAAVSKGNGGVIVPNSWYVFFFLKRNLFCIFF